VQIPLLTKKLYAKSWNQDLCLTSTAYLNLVSSLYTNSLSLSNPSKIFPSSDLYKEIKLEDTYTSEKDILNAFTGLFAGIEYARYKKTTNGKITFLQYSKDRINDLFKVPPNSFLTTTRISDYKTALFNIVEDIVKQSQLNNTMSFYKTISESELLSLRQQIYKLTNLISKFYIQKRIITYKVIEEYLNLYDEAAGCFETYMKINYCVEKILEGKACFFQSALDKNAFTVKKYLRTNNNYNVLLEPFCTVVWNSIKHKKVIRDPKNKKLDFNANPSSSTPNGNPSSGSNNPPPY
jgi:hypothetical protein